MFESWTFDGLPGRTLHVALYTDVTNCRFVWQPAATMWQLSAIHASHTLLQGAARKGQSWGGRA